jgi:hypothetical protein
VRLRQHVVMLVWRESCRDAAGTRAAARGAGLEGVEKLLTDSMVALLDGAGCQRILCVVAKDAGEPLLDAWQLLV